MPGVGTSSPCPLTRDDCKHLQAPPACHLEVDCPLQTAAALEHEFHESSNVSALSTTVFPNLRTAYMQVFVKGHVWWCFIFICHPFQHRAPGQALNLYTELLNSRLRGKHLVNSLLSFCLGSVESLDLVSVIASLFVFSCGTDDWNRSRDAKQEWFLLLWTRNELAVTCAWSLCLKLSLLGVDLPSRILLKWFFSFTADVHTFNSLIEATAMMNEKFEEKWNNMLVRRNLCFVF